MKDVYPTSPATLRRSAVHGAALTALALCGGSALAQAMQFTMPALPVIDGCNAPGGLQRITSSDEPGSAQFWCGTPPTCLTVPQGGYNGVSYRCAIIQYARREPRYSPNGQPGVNSVRDPQDLRCDAGLLAGMNPSAGICPTEPPPPPPPDPTPAPTPAPTLAPSTSTTTNTCPVGTSWDGVQCAPAPTSPPPTTNTCPVGTSWDGVQCAPAPTPSPTTPYDPGCPSGSTWDGTQCVVPTAAPTSPPPPPPTATPAPATTSACLPDQLVFSDGSCGYPTWATGGESATSYSDPTAVVYDPNCQSCVVGNQVPATSYSIP